MERKITVNLELETQPKYHSRMNINSKKKKRMNIRDFPGGAVVKNPPANAGQHGFSLGRPHML